MSLALAFEITPCYLNKKQNQPKKLNIFQKHQVLCTVSEAQQSSSIPGEPTAMWHFFSLTLSWLRGVPPMKTWHSKPSIFTPIVVITAWICTAISRVGAKIRICKGQRLNLKAAVGVRKLKPSLEP